MFSCRVLPFGMYNAPTTFQMENLSISSNLINEGLELYMDDFNPYGNDFDQALHNLKKVLAGCIGTKMCLVMKNVT